MLFWPCRKAVGGRMAGANWSKGFVAGDRSQELKAKDEAWGDVEGKLQESVTATEQDVKNAQERLKADQGACPKVNYK